MPLRYRNVTEGPPFGRIAATRQLCCRPPPILMDGSMPLSAARQLRAAVRVKDGDAFAKRRLQGAISAFLSLDAPEPDRLPRQTRLSSTLAVLRSKLSVELQAKERDWFCSTPVRRAGWAPRRVIHKTSRPTTTAFRLVTCKATWGDHDETLIVPAWSAPRPCFGPFTISISSVSVSSAEPDGWQGCRIPPTTRTFHRAYTKITPCVR